MFQLRIDHHFHSAGDCAVLAAIQHAQESIMATQTELAAAIAALTTNVAKVGDETRALIARIAELTAAIEAAGNTTPEVDAAVAALTEQVAIVDALVPDA